MKSDEEIREEHRQADIDAALNFILTSKLSYGMWIKTKSNGPNIQLVKHNSYRFNYLQ